MVGKRVFVVDIAHCSHCGGQLKLIAAIEESAAIARILTHLGLTAQPPLRAPAVRLDLFEAARGVNPDWILRGLGKVFGPSTRKRAQRMIKSRLMSGDFKKMASFEPTGGGQTHV